MAYSLTIGLALGSSMTGLTLRANLKDTAGGAVGGTVTTGFVELGAGNYSWTGTIPSGFQGSAVFADNGTAAVLAVAPINPADDPLTPVSSVTGDVGGDLLGDVSGSVGDVRGIVGGGVVGNVGGSVGSVTAPVTVGTNNDKAGYALSAAGLDAISAADPGVPANHTTLSKMLVAVYRALWKKITLSATEEKRYADNGTTVNGTAPVSDDLITQTRGPFA